MAIKSLILEDAGSKVKFLQEAATMAQFNHPNVIQLLGVVSEGSPVRSNVILCHVYLVHCFYLNVEHVGFRTCTQSRPQNTFEHSIAAEVKNFIFFKLWSELQSIWNVE